jgi:hypothetical protein
MYFSEHKDAGEWLEFLWEHQPHKRLELKLRRVQLGYLGRSRQIAMDRLDTLALLYPETYLVFRTRQRLLGKSGV